MNTIHQKTFSSFLLVTISFLFIQASLLAKDVGFTVTNVVGDVTYRAYKSFKRVPVKVDQKLDPKGKIALADGDMLDLKTPMGDVLNFKDKTYATLSKLAQNGADKQVEINMPLGKIECDVKKLSKESSFQVRTPSAVAGVRGTKFGVQINESGTVSVSVTEGLVAVQPTSGGSGGPSIPVSSGQKASVKSGSSSVSVEKSSGKSNAGGSSSGGKGGSKSSNSDSGSSGSSSDSSGSSIIDNAPTNVREASNQKENEDETNPQFEALTTDEQRAEISNIDGSITEDIDDIDETLNDDVPDVQGEVLENIDIIFDIKS